MRQLVRNVLVFFCLLFFVGCANHPTTPPKIPPYEVETRHYRSTERFDHVTVEVRADQRANSWVAGFIELPNAVAKELAVYLSRKDIRVSDHGDDAGAARLVVVGSGRDEYRLAVRLTDPDGALVYETTLYHDGGYSSAIAIAQQLAMLVADDMLLMWHPAVSAVGRDWAKPKPAPFTLLADPMQAQSPEGVSRVSWESFPSERLLRGADFSANDITDVSYELRFHKVYRPANPVIRWSPEGIYRVTGLTESEHTLPFLLPTCESASWSVRAHFRLHGRPRVTEWAGNYSTTFNPVGNKWPTIPPYLYRRGEDPWNWNLMYRVGELEHQIGGGTLVDIEPPPPLKCRHLDRGMFTLEKERAEADFESRVTPLAAGQSIAAIATFNDVCADKDCDVRSGTHEASEKLAECLENEFERRSFKASVHDLSKILSELPTPPDPDSESMDSAALLTLLRLPENKDYLSARGISYIVSTDMSLLTGPKSRDVESNVPHIDVDAVLDEDWESVMEGTIPLSVVSTNTRFVSSMKSAVIDTSNGEVVGTITSGAEGSKGSIVPIIVIIPIAYIPYGSRVRIEAKACDSMARRLSFMLRGGVSTGWPEEYFQDAYEPMWIHDGE